MPKPACLIAECERPSFSRRLCSKHYQRAKYRGELDVVAPNPAGLCEQCEQQIPVTRRWGAKFCSRACNQAHADAKKQQAIVESRGSARAQHCAWCREDLTDKRFGQRYCSRKCNDDWRNDQRRLAVLQVKKDARRKCAVCEQPIPLTRSTTAIYCSYTCKTQGGKSAHPDVKQQRLDYNRQYLYGLTPDDIDQMIAEQGGACAICRTTEPKGKGDWHVDHDHATGVIRGLLCHYCNLGLGKFKDNVDSLRRAVEYLERPPTAPVRQMRRRSKAA